ncbi:MAG: hypothetical protein EXQ96_06895 [Alphaproteobacteria bacterium]|nr:hypothetical protein [Alphaproteobacteria bacterium]
MSENGKTAAAWHAGRMGLELAPERAAELAQQVEAIGKGLRRMAAAGRFEDEPAAFAPALLRAAGEGRRG